MTDTLMFPNDETFTRAQYVGTPENAYIADLLDTGRLGCVDCRERAAVEIRGVYGNIALCAECSGALGADVCATNFGEFQAIEGGAA